MAETLMSGHYSYNEAVAKLIVREPRIQDVEVASNKARITTYGSPIKKCHVPRKQGHLAKNCWHKNLEYKNSENKGKGRNNPRACFKCGSAGHIAKYCKWKDLKSDKGHLVTSLVTFSLALMTIKEENFSQWIIDSACTWHMTKDRSNFCSFPLSLAVFMRGVALLFSCFEVRICKSRDDG